MIAKSVLWELADQWETVAKDKDKTSPLGRFYLEQARKELVMRLGERQIGGWKPGTR